MSKIFKTLLFFFILSATAHAAALPIVFNSDLTGGPNTGGQSNKGVFVTIWGKNFGASQGGSTVTVGGGLVDNYPTWSDTMITFQLGSLAVTGNIVVTTAAGASSGTKISKIQTSTFTVQSGNIYFVDETQGSNGTGTYASPYNKLLFANQVVAAGDTVYVRASTIVDEIASTGNCIGWHSMLCQATSGTSAKPISWIAYPNESVTLKADGGTQTYPSGTDTVQYVFRANGGNYINVSKFHLISLSATSSNPVVQGNTGWTVIGNNYYATNAGFNGVVSISGANTLALDNISNGSYCTNAGTPNECHEIYENGPSNPFEIGWNTFINDKDEGAMIQSYHNGPRIGTIHDNLIVNNLGGAIKGILCDGSGDGGSGNPDSYSTMTTNNISCYNNILVNVGSSGHGGSLQVYCGTNYIYNNTLYGNGADTEGLLQAVHTAGCGPGGGAMSNYVANNIFESLNSSGYITNGEGGGAPTWTDFTVLADNIYFGNGNGPTQDTTAINSDPKFNSPNTGLTGDFTLQSGSPAIAAGYNTNSVVPLDFIGVTRPNPPAIGVYEPASACTANGGSSTPGPCCSGFSSGGLCVVYVCGDGIVTSPEVCDTSGPQLNGATCQSKGFTGGTLNCAAGCLSFDTSSCTNASPSVYTATINGASIAGGSIQ